MNRIIRSVIFRTKALLKKDPDKFLKKVSGVVHVGANTGQEIKSYARYGLNVVWIEPIPEVFKTLQQNLAGIKRQVAIQGLVTDVDNKEYEFHVANNYGASSSILELNLHEDIWPEIRYEKTIKINSMTLPSLLQANNIDLAKYDTLIMDTQGSELLVLEGAISILEHFTYIKTEVSDFESYKGCCQLKDIDAFLSKHGYSEYSRHKFVEHPEGGGYYDVIYKRNSGK